MIRFISSFLIFLSLASIEAVDFDDNEDVSCGYASCNPGMPDRLNVHIVAHSHDDVGWLKTVDQYYSGSYRSPWSGDQENQRAGVQYTLDTVVRELAFDPNKKYIQVETAFFWRWWNEQDDQMKNLVHELVRSGQIEFIGGGWCMNDEAAAHYVAIIDQMSLGFKKLRDTFGECGIPRVAWQIDPFGHSREQADIFASFGMDGLFFGRLDWREKGERLRNKTGEMIWMTSDSKSENNKLLTGVLFNNYSPPSDFCWDLLCNDEPLMDSSVMHDYNIDAKAKDFINYVRNQHKYYASNHVLLTMGMDFHYQAAHTWYKNLDKLIAYVNTNYGESEKLFLMYSTPLCYIKSLNEEGLEWPTKTDDFFPYASDPHAYWTGYFTSRPNSKRFIREASNYLQFAKQFTSRILINNIDKAPLLLKATERLNRAVAVAQHHDAITGTEKQHVANDYHLRLDGAITNFMNSAEVVFCPLLNISQCDVTENIADAQTVVVYNPLGHVRSSVVHLPVVTSEGWIITNDQGQVLNHQVTPLMEQVLQIPGRQSLAQFDLAFVAADVPPLTIRSFRIQKSNSKNVDDPSIAKKISMTLGQTYEFPTHKGTMSVVVNSSGLTVTYPKEKISVIHRFGYYQGHPGNNTEFEFRASGAYIFRPLEQEPFKIPGISSEAFTGPLYNELHVTHENSASKIFRLPLFPALFDAEIEWLVGPISVDDGFGKEYISIWKAGNEIEFEQNGVFYTDANGRQTMERVRGSRPSYDVGNATLEEPVASNYYPINSAIFIKDQQMYITIVNDRAQGGSSLHDGEIELMLHRRLLDDDAFGVDEPLNEEAYQTGLVTRGKHYIIFGSDFEDEVSNRRQLSNEVFGNLIVIFPPNEDNESFKQKFHTNDLAARDIYQLPPNVNLLTFEPWLNSSSDYPNKQYLVRLEHLFEVGEHPTLSDPVTVSLLKLFGPMGSGIGVTSWIRETTLGGNQWIEDSKRFDWKVQGQEQTTDQSTPFERVADVDDILLDPMEIRTFIVEFF